MPVRPVVGRRNATSVEDAGAFVRSEIAAGRVFEPGFRLSVRTLAKLTPCARQTAMLALQALRAAGAVTLDERGVYRLGGSEP